MINVPLGTIIGLYTLFMLMIYVLSSRLSFAEYRLPTKVKVGADIVGKERRYKQC